jgi:hypothetical protein
MRPRFLKPNPYIDKSLVKSIVLAISYVAWILAFRLISLSFVVYFLTRAGHPATFEEINDAFSNNEITFIGLSAGCFLFLLKSLAPLIEASTSETELKFSFRDIRDEYFPGFLQGALLALSIVAGLLLTGCVRYVGFFVQIEDAGLAVLGIVLRVIALIAIGLCEEYLFRRVSRTVPVQIGILALLFSVVKLAQFDLSWMHFATLFLLSTALSARRSQEKSFLPGAGFFSALLIVFHPLLSLPILGSDFSGIFLLKYQPQAFVPAAISGGAGGPLSSLALQAILLIETIRGWISHKKSLLKAPASL